MLQGVTLGLCLQIIKSWILYAFFILPIRGVCPANIMLVSIVLIINFFGEAYKFWNLLRSLHSVPKPLVICCLVGTNNFIVTLGEKGKKKHRPFTNPPPPDHLFGFTKILTKKTVQYERERGLHQVVDRTLKQALWQVQERIMLTVNTVCTPTV